MKTVAYQHCLASSDDNALVDIELDMPLVRGQDCLVEIKAISVNPVDIKIRTSVEPAEGEYGVLGWDASGIIREIGSHATGFSPGDEVWYAGALNRPGCNSQFHLVDERVIALKPKNLSFSDAAALPLTSLTAWETLFDRLQINLNPEQDQRLLITGAAGGVGSAMIQLAASMSSSKVIATASREETKKWVQHMGAHYVLNHRYSLADELVKSGLSHVTHVASLNQTDQHFPDLVKMLKPQGKLALIDSPAKPLDIQSMKQKSLSLHWEYMGTRSMFETEDMIKQHHILTRISEQVEMGVIRSTMQQHFGLINAKNLRRAHRFMETGASIGKIVLEGF